MADIDMATFDGNGSHQGLFSVKKVYVVDNVVDFADATTAKGSALAANDTVQALNLPAGAVVLAAGLQVVEAMTGTSTDLTLDVGYTGGNVDEYVDGFDYDGASVGDVAGLGTAAMVFNASADTIDILIASQTGTFTGGKVRVFAVVADMTEKLRPGNTTLGS